MQPLQGINFIIIKGVYFNFIVESLSVISLSKIPFVLISIFPGSCFVLTNNKNEDITDKMDEMVDKTIEQMLEECIKEEMERKENERISREIAELAAREEKVCFFFSVLHFFSSICCLSSSLYCWS